MTTALTVAPSMTIGNHEELMRAAQRIKTMVKGGNKLSDHEAMALAQISFVTHLNPYIGEVWYIPGKGPMVGIAGARKMDNQRTEERGGYTWETYDPVPPEEAGAIEAELSKVAAAFKCTVHDSAAIAQYQTLFSDTLKMLREAGTEDPFAEAKEICGNRPEWVGFGYSLTNEPSQMKKIQLARKRAHADALKKRVVIPFGGEVAETDAPPDYDVDVEGVDLEYPPDVDAIVGELMGESKAMPHPDTRKSEIDGTQVVSVLLGDTLNELVKMNLFENERAAAKVMSQLFKKQSKAPFKKIVDQARAYRAKKDEGLDTDKAIAAVLESA